MTNFRMLIWVLAFVSVILPKSLLAIPADAKAVCAKYFPTGGEGARLVTENGTSRYYILTGGGNPFGESKEAVLRKLNLRAKSRLLRHLAGEKAGESILELSGWETIGFWEDDEVLYLLTKVDKDKVRLVERSEGKSVKGETDDKTGGDSKGQKTQKMDGEASIEKVLVQANSKDQISNLKKLFGESKNKMAIWVEIREICRIQGDIDCYNESVNAIMDLKMQ